MSGSGSERVPETEEERALAEISAQRFQRYRKKFQPIEERVIKDIQDTEGERAKAMGLSNVDYATQFGRQASDIERLAAQRGGMTGLDIAQYQQQAASGAGSGLANVESGTETARLQNLLSMIQRGQGVAGGALSGLGEAASASQAQATRDAQAALAARHALGDLVGTGLAYGASAYSPSKGLNVPTAGNAANFDAMRGVDVQMSPTHQPNMSNFNAFSRG